MALSPVYIEPQFEYDTDGTCTDTYWGECLISQYDITYSIQHLSSTLEEQHIKVR